MKNIQNESFDEYLDNFLLSPYNNFLDFQKNYANDYYEFSSFTSLTFIEYLEKLRDLYEFHIKVVQETKEELYDEDYIEELMLTLDFNIKLLNAFCEDMDVDDKLSDREKFIYICNNNWHSIYAFLQLNYEDILSYINGEIIKCNSITETPEIDLTETDDKVKLIILEKLGVINYIKNLQTSPTTIIHTAQILATFTGIKQDTLYSYLRPMISPIPDKSDKNSPYKNPENEFKANNKIIKLKIKNN